MKRMIAILLAVLALTGVLTACSGTAYYDDGMGYGNVSTTPNGRVNGGMADGPMGGMFDEGGRGNYGGSAIPGTGSNGQSGSRGMTGTQSNGRGMGNGNGSGNGMSNGSMGTGMAGSR